MRAPGWAGEASLPLGWPAGMIFSPASADNNALNWSRICFGRRPCRTFRRILLWSVSALLLFHYLLVPIKVTGASMTPTYRDGAVNFVNRLAYSHKLPSRGDVVVLHDGEDLILKRIIALPGESISLDRGQFIINSAPLRDRFSAVPVNWDFETITLGLDEYFVIGDNRTYSVFGKFPKQAILGKIIF